MAATMTDEDQELFLEMLLKLDETHDSIKAASKWCRANATCDEEIVRMWFFAVAKAQSQSQRLYLFHLASDILFTAEPSSIHYFSSFLPQIFKAIPFARGEEIRNDMMKLFSIWRNKKIYNKVVVKRLIKSLKNRNKVVDMAIFKYDRELLFKNLKRVGDLKPACDYLSRGVDFAPSFDNSQALLSTIKERKACQSLLASVDSHKSKVTSLVSYMEEMVHLLKMASTTLDLAGNKEQNGVEETKMRILAYGKYQDAVKGVLSALEKQWGLKREDYAKPATPASPEPDEENLYSRRVGTVGVPGDPRLANVPVPPVVIPSVPIVVPPVPAGISAIPVGAPVVSSWGGAAPSTLSKPEEIFHRRDRTGSMTPRHEEMWPLEDLPFTNPAPPPLPTDDVPFIIPRPPLPREGFLFQSPRAPRDDMGSMDVSVRSCVKPVREDPRETPRRARPRDEPRTPRSHPPQDDLWEAAEPHRTPRREEPWDTPRWRTPRDEPLSPRPRYARDEPFDTPRPHTAREEPWERSRVLTSRDRSWERSRGVTPTRDEYGERHGGVTPTHDERWERSRGLTPTKDEPWSPDSPLYTGETSWGPPMKKPVYMPCFTGFHLENPRSSEQSSDPPFKAPDKRPLKPTGLTPSAPRRKSLLGDPRPIPRLGDDRPPLLGRRPALLPSPAIAPIPTLLNPRTCKKRR